MSTPYLGRLAAWDRGSAALRPRSRARFEPVPHDPTVNLRPDRNPWMGSDFGEIDLDTEPVAAQRDGTEQDGRSAPSTRREPDAATSNRNSRRGPEADVRHPPTTGAGSTADRQHPDPLSAAGSGRRADGSGRPDPSDPTLSTTPGPRELEPPGTAGRPEARHEPGVPEDDGRTPTERNVLASLPSRRHDERPADRAGGPHTRIFRIPPVGSVDRPAEPASALRGSASSVSGLSPEHDAVGTGDRTPVLGAVSGVGRMPALPFDPAGSLRDAGASSGRVGAEAVAAEPAVHVWIDRIQVRVQAPPGVRAPKTAAATGERIRPSSLEDYLDARSRGR